MSKTAENYYDIIMSVESLSDAGVSRAKEIFDSYVKSGVFTGCEFEDAVWNTTDEYSNVGLHFDFNEFSYKSYYGKMFGIPLADFVTYVKIFVTMMMGKIVLKTIQTFLNDVKRIIKTPVSEVFGASVELTITIPSVCIDFFTMLPESADEESVNLLLDGLESCSFSNKYRKSQRELAQFDSYFLFNDILDDYWGRSMEKEERLFYYPLYLWWHITGVIPLRPREFILTQRDCLEKRKDGYYLTLRRDKLKGGKRKVYYNISEDYDTSTYKIPEKLGNEISRYLDYTKEYDNTDIHTLFVSDTHYKKWKQKKHSNSRYLTYINFNTILRYFYAEVIEGKYGIRVVSSEQGHLHKGEINYLHLGDTRHIALINIIAEGGTPLTAMLLAGHSDINMAAHYYSNLTNLIECRTYRQYRLITKGTASYEVSTAQHLPVRSDRYVELHDGGRCYSEKMMNKDISDCQCAVGPRGEIGYCLECGYYRNKGESYFSLASVYKRHIKADTEHLAEAVALVRKGMGKTEDIGSALLKLKASSYSYQEFCNEKLAHDIEKGANPWDERK